MAFWNRRKATVLDPKQQEIAQVADAIVDRMKSLSLAGTPLAGSYPSPVSVQGAINPYDGMPGIGRLTQATGSMSYLPRPAEVFGSQLGPNYPLLPAALDPVLDATGRPLPRKWEYPVAINLNLTQNEVPYVILRQLAEQCDIIARCIEIRVAEIVKRGWSFGLDDQCIANIMQAKGVSHARAAKIGMDQYGDEINRLTAFWKNPYVASGRGFSEWITESLFQIFYYDQWCVYPRYDMNTPQNLIGFDILDAPTIKLLQDNRGDIPHPPSVAFQQILFGFPRGEFTSSPDSDGDFYNGAMKGGAKTDRLSVFVKKRRTSSPYGYSPVELCIPMAALYLQRQAWLRAEYTEGATPQTWMKTDALMTDPLKWAEQERMLNDRLSGQTAERHRIKALPAGFDPMEMRQTEDTYKNIYDDMIKGTIASFFGVAPAQVGVLPKAGLGGGKGAQEGESENAETVSEKPMEQYVVDCINALCIDYLEMDHNVSFVLNEEGSAQATLIKAQADSLDLHGGVLTANDVRGDRGMPLFDMPEADEPFIVAGNQVIFLKGLLAVDAAGETIGAAPDVTDPNAGGNSGPDAQEAQVPQSAQGKEGQGPKGNGQAGSGGKDQSRSESSALKFTDPDKVAEAKAYHVWKKAPRSRDFVFKHLSEDEQSALKAGLAPDRPKRVFAY